MLGNDHGNTHVNKLGQWPMKSCFVMIANMYS